MIQVKRIVQIVLGVGLLVLVIWYYRANQIGQNIINTLVPLIFFLGFDHIIIFYRYYLDKSSFQHEATFTIFSLFVLGLLFQAFNSSPKSNIFLNQMSFFFILILLSVNCLYYILMFIIIAGYLIRYLYRLMTDTLLTNNGVLEESQLQALMRQRKPYDEIAKENPLVNKECSICINDFEQQNLCIVLPECQHCFHDECIEGWLRNKSTCPYCRGNLYLNLL